MAGRNGTMKGKRLKDLIRERFPDREDYDRAIGSFDIIGDIGIIKVEDEWYGERKEIAELLQKLHPQIRCVLLKVEQTGGEFRIPDYEAVWGCSGGSETTHREYGCTFLLDPKKAYFTSRLGSERERIVSEVTDGERILVLFAGIGPYPIQIARNRECEIVGVEKNPEAAYYFVENVRKNKVGKKVTVIEGDAFGPLPGVEGTFDRIILPLPKDAYRVLGRVRRFLKAGTVIHLYGFSDAVPSLLKEVNERGFVLKKTVSCGAFGPYVARLCFDLVQKLDGGNRYL